MVSFVPTMLVPLLAGLALLPTERWRTLAWAPIVWAPDLDYVIPAAHRAITHSALVPLALVAALLVLWRRRDPTARLSEFITRPGAPANLFLPAFFLFSHIVLDVFAGGVVLLWPLLNVNVFLGFEILLYTDTNTFAPRGEAGTAPGAPDVSPVYPWLSFEDTAIGAAALLAAGLWAWLHRPRRVVVWRHATPVTPIHKE